MNWRPIKDDVCLDFGFFFLPRNGRAEENHKARYCTGSKHWRLSFSTSRCILLERFHSALNSVASFLSAATASCNLLDRALPLLLPHIEPRGNFISSFPFDSYDVLSNVIVEIVHRWKLAVELLLDSSLSPGSENDDGYE